MSAGGSLAESESKMQIVIILIAVALILWGISVMAKARKVENQDDIQRENMRNLYGDNTR